MEYSYIFIEMLIGDREPTFLLTIVWVFTLFGGHLLLVDWISLLERSFTAFKTAFFLVLLGTIALLLFVSIQISGLNLRLFLECLIIDLSHVFMCGVHLSEWWNVHIFSVLLYLVINFLLFSFNHSSSRQFYKNLSWFFAFLDNFNLRVFKSHLIPRLILNKNDWLLNFLFFNNLLHLLFIFDLPLLIVFLPFSLVPPPLVLLPLGIHVLLLLITILVIIIIRT